MKPGMRIKGGDELIAAFRYCAEKVPDHARRTMQNVTDKIVILAKLQTPHDTGDLEDSIHKVVNRGERGRLEIDIVGGEGLDYAAEIDQNYSHMGIGPGTFAKMEANPGIDIGEDFIGRAVDFYAEKLPEEIFQVTMQTIAATALGDDK